MDIQTFEDCAKEISPFTDRTRKAARMVLVEGLQPEYVSKKTRSSLRVVRLAVKVIDNLASKLLPRGMK